MAFCNSCGATLDAGVKFCNKCGATQPTAPAASTTPLARTSTPAPKSNSALKIILIVVGVIVGLGILGVGVASFVAYRIATHTRVHNRDGNVRVETPFGTVQSSTDPDEAARNLGIDVYPGAQVVKGSSANMNMGNMHTASAEFESSDPVSSVAEFYKSKLPGANVISSAGDHYSIISTEKKNMLTINIEPRDGKTRIQIARVSGKMVNGDSDSDN